MLTLCKEQVIARKLIQWQADEFVSRQPKGTKFIGEGAYRMVYRSEGNVYKIPYYLDGESLSANEYEYENWHRISKLEDFIINGARWSIPRSIQLFRFPEFGDFDGYHASVIVMPFVPGQKAIGACMDDCGVLEAWDCLEYDQANTYYGLVDISNDNVLLQEDGTRVLIDLQC